MAKVEVRCPYCGTNEIVKYGKEKTGVQRYKCMIKNAAEKFFSLNMLLLTLFGNSGHW